MKELTENGRKLLKLNVVFMPSCHFKKSLSLELQQNEKKKKKETEKGKQSLCCIKFLILTKTKYMKCWEAITALKYKPI